MKILAIVLYGDGINCERETAAALSLAGFQVKLVHINDLNKEKESIKNSHLLAFPGGFSFGDDLGSGRILALKLKTNFEEELLSFVNEKKLVIGICNGFQALTQLGLLPMPFKARTISLAENASGGFINKWVSLKIENSVSVFTKFMKQTTEIELPIRHGEGRVTFAEPVNENYDLLKKNKQIVFTYKENVNGSHGQIAGICDPNGLILGLMPHPEAFVSNLTHPTRAFGAEKFSEGDGLQLFKSAFQYLKQG